MRAISNPIRASILTAAVAALVVVPSGAPSSASGPTETDQGALVCTGSIVATYDPPLGVALQETDVRVTEDFTCQHPAIVSGESTSNYRQQASCLFPSLEDTIPAPATVTYTWDTGDGTLSSTITYTTTVVTHPAGLTVVFAVGDVIDGYREGGDAAVTVVRTNIDVPACLVSNVEKDQGTVELVIS